MSDYILNILVVGKDDGASEVVQRLVHGLDDVGRAGDQVKDQSGGLFSKLTVTAGDAVQAVQAVAGAVKGVYDGMVGGNAQFEDYNVQFTTLLHSSEKAKDRLAELADFGAKTPFELPQVVEADRVLQGFGLEAENVAEKFGFSGKEIRTIVGDVASGTGASFKEMADAVGRFSAGATGEAIARFQELGITTRAELTEMGLKFSGAGQLLSPLPQAMEVVLTLMKQKYGGLMDAQSATFNGMLSNLADWKGQTLRQLGEPIFEALKPQLTNLLAFLGSDATKQAIHDFAAGIASGIEVIGQIASTIHDYGIPALSGLTAATIAYALTTLPVAIPSIVAATTAFATQAVAVAAAVAPLAAVALAVGGVVKAYQNYQDQVQNVTQKVLNGNAAWREGTQVLDDYHKADVFVQQATHGQAEALEQLRAKQEQQVATYAQYVAIHGNATAEAERQRKAINDLGGTITETTGALHGQIDALNHLHDTDAVEGIRALRDAQGGLTQAVQLTDKELEKIQKDIDKVYKDGPAALQATAQTINQFLDQQAQAQAAHEDKLTQLVKDKADARTKAARDAVQAKIDAEGKGYAEQEAQAAIAYAREEAAQKAHLGQELIDYVQAMELKNSAFREKGDQLVGAIAQQFGITQSLSSQVFGSMLSDIDHWAASGGQSANSLASHLDETTSAAATTQQRMDALAKQYTIELIENTPEAERHTQAYLDKLASIPAYVRTVVEIEEHHSRLDTGDGPSNNHGQYSGNAAAGGGTFVTRGPTTLTVGDNPGGQELVHVIPLSGRGQTRVGHNMVALAGGGTVLAGGADAAPGAAGGDTSGAASTLAEANQLLTLAATYAQADHTNTDLLKRYGERVGTAVKIIDDMAAAVEALGEPAPPLNQAYVAALLAEAQAVVAALQSQIIPISEKEAAAAGRYADVEGKAVAILKSGADLRVSLAELRPPLDVAVVQALTREIAAVVAVFSASLIPTTQAEADAVGLWAGVVGNTVAPLKSILDLRTAMQNVGAPLLFDPASLLDAMGMPEGATTVNQLAREVAGVVAAIEAALIPITEEQAAVVGRFGDAEGKAIGALKDALSLSGDMFTDYHPPTDDQIQQVAADANRVTQAFAAAAATYDAQALPAASAFAEATAHTFATVKDGLLVFEAINSGDYALDPTKLQLFEDQSILALGAAKRLGAIAVTIPAADMTALQHASSALSAQADALIRLAAVPASDAPSGVAGAAFGLLGGAGGAGGGTTINLTVNVDARGAIDPRAVEEAGYKGAQRALRELNDRTFGRR